MVVTVTKTSFCKIKPKSKVVNITSVTTHLADRYRKIYSINQIKFGTFIGIYNKILDEQASKQQTIAIHE